MSTTFRPYKVTDRESCLAIFDANCPEFFAPTERDEYVEFLDDAPDGYEVCVDGDQVLGAFGVFPRDENEMALRWILLDPRSQGRGIGADIMARVVDRSNRAGASRLKLFTTQKVQPFFARYGAQTLSVTENGFGPGLHVVDMVLDLQAPKDA